MDDEDDDEELDALIEQELENLTNEDLENDVNNEIIVDQSSEDDMLLDYDISFSKYFALITTSDVIAQQKVEDAEDLIEAAGKVKLHDEVLLQKKLEDVLYDVSQRDILEIHKQVITDVEKEMTETLPVRKVDTQENMDTSETIKTIAITSENEDLDSIERIEEEARKQLNEFNKRIAEEELKQKELLEQRLKDEAHAMKMKEERREKNQKELLELKIKFEKNKKVMQQTLQENLAAEEKEINEYQQMVKETIDKNLKAEKKRLKQIQDEILRNELKAKTSAALCIQKHYRRVIVQNKYGRTLQAMKDKRLLKAQTKKHLLDKQEVRRQTKEKAEEMYAVIEKENQDKKEKERLLRIKNMKPIMKAVNTDSQTVNTDLQTVNIDPQTANTVSQTVNTDPQTINTDPQTEDEHSINKKEDKIDEIISSESNENEDETLSFLNKNITTTSHTKCSEEVVTPLGIPCDNITVQQNIDTNDNVTSSLQSDKVELSNIEKDSVETNKLLANDTITVALSQVLPDHTRDQTRDEICEEKPHEIDEILSKVIVDIDKRNVSSCSLSDIGLTIQQSNELFTNQLSNELFTNQQSNELFTNQQKQDLIFDGNEGLPVANLNSVPDMLPVMQTNPLKKDMLSVEQTLSTSSTDLSTDMLLLKQTSGNQPTDTHLVEQTKTDEQTITNLSTDILSVEQPSTSSLADIFTVEQRLVETVSDKDIPEIRNTFNTNIPGNTSNTCIKNNTSLISSNNDTTSCSVEIQLDPEHSNNTQNITETYNYQSIGLFNPDELSADDVFPLDLCEVYKHWKESVNLTSCSPTTTFNEIPQLILCEVTFHEIPQLILCEDDVLVLKDYDAELPAVNERHQCLILKNCIVNLSSLPKLTNLKFLKLEDCEISKTLLLPIYLTILHLPHNKLTNTNFLKGLKYLVELNLENNNITRVGYLKDCMNLHYLNVNDNNIVSLKDLKHLPYLHILLCQNNDIISINEVSTCNLLVTLDMTNNNLTKIPELKNNVLLKTLVLDRNNITTISSISNYWLPSIQTLSLQGNSLQELASLSNLMLLRSLNVADNLLIGTESFHHLLLCQSLKHIQIHGNPIANGQENYEALKTLLPSLNSIDDQKLEQNMEVHDENCTCHLCCLLSHQLKYTTDIWCKQAFSVQSILNELILDKKIFESDSPELLHLVITKQCKKWFQLRELLEKFQHELMDMFGKSNNEETTEMKDKTKIIEQENLAATKIQSAYRGFKVYRAYCLFKQSRDNFDDDVMDDEEEFEMGVDLSDFDFDEASLDCNAPPTPRLLNSTVPLPAIPKVEKPYNVTSDDPQEKGMFQDVDAEVQVKEAWVTPPSSARSDLRLPFEAFERSPDDTIQNDDSMSLDSRSLGTSSSTGGLSKRADDISNEWGFHNHMTAELMMKRARKMGAGKRRKPLRKRNLTRRRRQKPDPDERFRLFQKSSQTITSHATHRKPRGTERQSYFSAQESLSHKTEASNHNTYSWICDQAVFHQDRTQELLLLNKNNNVKTNDDENKTSFTRHSSEPLILPPLSDSVLMGRPPSLIQSEVHNPKPPPRQKASLGSGKLRQRILKDTHRPKAHSAPSPTQRTDVKEEKWKSCVYR